MGRNQSAGTRNSNGPAFSPAWIGVSGAAALVLVSVVTLELLSPTAQTDRDRRIVHPAMPRSGPAVARPIAAWIDAARARPLFAPGRRPPSATAISDSPLPRLAGTIKSGNEVVALFAPDSAARLIAVRRNTEIAGWTVVDITNDAVVLARDGHRIRLGLAFADRPVSAQPLGATIADGACATGRPDCSPGPVVTEMTHTALLPPAKAARVDVTR